MGHPSLIIFLDALASLDFKFSVTEWVTFLQIAHLRVFQIISFESDCVRIHDSNHNHVGKINEEANINIWSRSLPPAR